MPQKILDFQISLSLIRGGTSRRRTERERNGRTRRASESFGTGTLLRRGREVEEAPARKFEGEGDTKIFQNFPKNFDRFCYASYNGSSRGRGKKNQFLPSSLELKFYSRLGGKERKNTEKGKGQIMAQDTRKKRRKFCKKTAEGRVGVGGWSARGPLDYEFRFWTRSRINAKNVDERGRAKRQNFFGNARR